jgi:hypothetical protein
MNGTRRMWCNRGMRQTQISLPRWQGWDVKRIQVSNFRNCKQYVQHRAEQVCHLIHPVTKEHCQLPIEDVQ